MEFVLKNFEMAVVVTRIANIHYFEFTNNYHTKRDCHQFCELIYVDDGTISVESEHFKGELKNNQLIIHQPGEVHSLSCPDNSAPDVIIIGFECQCKRLYEFSEKKTTLSTTLQKLLAEIIKEGRSVFQPPYDVPYTTDMKISSDYIFGAGQMIKILLENFLIKLVRENQTGESNSSQTILGYSRLADVKKYIDDNIKKNISLSELCFLFGTNKTSLCKLFKEIYNETIIDYVNQRKIKLSKTMLREGNLSITQISEDLGFCSIHYFSRTFKKYEKQSPSAYLRMIKSKLEESSVL